MTEEPLSPDDKDRADIKAHGAILVSFVFQNGLFLSMFVYRPS